MMVCILASCSDGGSENPIEPTPKPEEVKTEITIDSSIISNGLSFSAAGGEQSISFSVNANWTLSIASTTSGTTWCKASATSGSKGTANVKFTIGENTDYEDRSVSVTIKAGTVSKTFTITQKGVDALLVTTTKYEVAQDGGQIEIEVKANIDYKMEISEEAKDWIKESSGRALTTYKHKLDIAMNEDAEKREGEITFKSGDKVETVKVYQAGGAILVLSQNEYNVSDKGDTISVDIKSNIDFGIQMPDVDWIIDEASSRGMSSHTLKYIVSANEGYDSRSAEIVFYDKNSDLKDTLKVVQAQKDVIILSKKELNVEAEGGLVEIKIEANIDFEVDLLNTNWIKESNDSRSLSEYVKRFTIDKNESENERNAKILFYNKSLNITDTLYITQKGIYLGGKLKEHLGGDWLKITTLSIDYILNMKDIECLRQMLGAPDFIEKGNLRNLDLSKATIISEGSYTEITNNSISVTHYKSDKIIGDKMFQDCVNLQTISLPENIVTLGSSVFSGCTSLSSIILPYGLEKIGGDAFFKCSSLSSINIPENVSVIGRRAFMLCDVLKEIILPKKITTISEFLFCLCSSLKKVVIPNEVINIERYAFEGCEQLSNVNIPSSVTTIGQEAFGRCKSITNIKLPDGLISLGSSAFFDCSSITNELIIPEKITVVNDFTFGNCISLEKVVIPEGITSIGKHAFANCRQLTSIIIPSKVTTVGSSAFSNCKKINKVTCKALTPPTLGSDAFIGVTASLFVPISAKSEYEKSNWSTYFISVYNIE